MQRLVLIGVRLMLILFSSVAAILVGARIVYGDEPTEQLGTLLAPYAEVLPGQSMDLFTPTWCSFYDEYYGSYWDRQRVCRRYPTESPVSSVSIYIHNHTIQQLKFRLRDLYLGDLMRLWGRPLILYSGGDYFAHWRVDAYTIRVSVEGNRRFSFRLPVDFLYVELTAEDDDQ